MSAKHRSVNRGIIFVSLTVAVFTALLVPLPADADSSSQRRFGATAPSVDVNLFAEALRKPTQAQLLALDQFRSTYGSQATVRWNSFTGSPDSITNLSTPPSSDTPENTARAFVNANSSLFGVDGSSLVLADQKEALGGYLLKFQQRVGELDVRGGGLGFVMTADKRIRMVMGSTYRDASISGAPVLTALAASTSAQTALASYATSRPPGVDQYLTPAFNALQAELAPALRPPTLHVFPTASGFNLAWSVMTFSRNPFGLFVTDVDAANGQVLAREDLVRYQEPLPYTADIYPNHPVLKNPGVTDELELDENGQPAGLLRVQLRNFNPGTNATGLEGTLSGTHALVRNLLASKLPFAQSALGTFHFRQNNPPLEGQPNESDDLAEPAEHIDGVNIFFFINYLLEYVDYLHKDGDRVHSRIGQGDFPDSYPNSDRPLLGLVHFPNAAPEVIGQPIDTTDEQTIIKSVLGFDNAFSVPATFEQQTPAGTQQIIVNPTVYGHGYYFNDLAKDGAVAYHEGMHSISTPLAGFAGSPEGGALNEGQADLWAYTITNADAIGEYVASSGRACSYLQLVGLECVPALIGHIRSARSTLKYSQLGTTGGDSFEVHQDGEIYASAMFDLRELMIAAQPEVRFVRPAFLNGQPTRGVSIGQESWERIFLGSIYLLGLTTPDTFVKARDALIEADRILYSTDPLDPELDAPGQHEALIWQVFASHELGSNAASPLGGRQTISTSVTQFASDQAHVGAPQGILVQPTSLKSIQVSWQLVSGAFAYEVFKREVGKAGERQFKGVSGREYFDGDVATTGWSHVAYVTGGSTAYEDKGPILSFFKASGISSTAVDDGFNELIDTEYAVRALSVNPNRQVGVSDLSAGASIASTIQDVTAAVKTAISNVSFAGGVFEFDQTLKNNGVNSTDHAIYSPITFKIVQISNPAITVKNADNGGDGQQTPALFAYRETLPAGATSSPRRLQFNNTAAQLFTFDAMVTARVRTEQMPVNGSQPGDGTVGQNDNLSTITSETDTYTGIVVVGTGGVGAGVVNSLNYADVTFIARPNSFGVDATLTAGPLASGPYPDLDFQLRDEGGRVLASSGNFGPNEELGGPIVPGRTYIYRVIGFINGPTQFTINSKMYFGGPFATGDGGSTSGGSGLMPAGQGFTLVQFVRFTVNPLTGSVTTQIL